VPSNINTGLVLTKAVEAYRAHVRASFLAETKEAEMHRATALLRHCTPGQQRAYEAEVAEIDREYTKKWSKLNRFRANARDHTRRLAG